MEILSWIQNWYKSNCDGDWEHSYGVKIDTLDNPGWLIEINLDDTDLEECAFLGFEYDHDDNDWVICYRKANLFIGTGGPFKLEELLNIFKDWVESQKPPSDA